MESMKLSEYQEKAWASASYQRRGRNVEYPTLGMAGEAGEVCNKVKKIDRDFGGVITEEMRAAILDEVGDVLWYVAAICTELKESMDVVAQNNLAKLQGRCERGTLHGSGDKR